MPVLLTAGTAVLRWPPLPFGHVPHKGEGLAMAYSDGSKTIAMPTARECPIRAI